VTAVGGARPPTLTLRVARPEEASALSDLCLRSKAVWDYDEAFLDACRDELTVTPESMSASLVQVAEIDGSVVAVVQLAVNGNIAELDKLFVDPQCLRAGAGRALFAWAAATARQLGAKSLVIASDPGATDFYRRMGAVDDGWVPSGSVPGRFIPRLMVLL
jgi:N-acetylglutamate synthase-like GNAT family acetyltransferase